MSQIGGMAMANPAAFPANGSGVTLRDDAMDNTMNRLESLQVDSYQTERATFLMVFSVLGLMGNSLSILLCLAVPTLRISRNSFFLHQSALDVVKSSYCIVFSQVRYKPSTFSLHSLLTIVYLKIHTLFDSDILLYSM